MKDDGEIVGTTGDDGLMSCSMLCDVGDVACCVAVFGKRNAALCLNRNMQNMTHDESTLVTPILINLQHAIWLSPLGR